MKKANLRRKFSMVLPDFFCKKGCRSKKTTGKLNFFDSGQRSGHKMSVCRNYIMCRRKNKNFKQKGCKLCGKNFLPVSVVLPPPKSDMSRPAGSTVTS